MSDNFLNRLLNCSLKEDDQRANPVKSYNNRKRPGLFASISLKNLANGRTASAHPGRISVYPKYCPKY